MASLELHLAAKARDEPFESPSETVVNTTNTSPIPSIYEPSTPESDLEAGPTEKSREHGEESQQGPLSCVDPKTHIVGWNGPDDPENPMNFSQAKKWWMTIILAMCTFCVSFASSVFSTATTVTSAEFDVSVEVMILGVSLYVLGFAFGTCISSSARNVRI